MSKDAGSGQWMPAGRHIHACVGAYCIGPLESLGVSLGPFGPRAPECLKSVPRVGDRKSLSIAENHLKPSQEFPEQFGPFIYKMKGFSRNSPQKVHANFAENLGREILGNTFSGLKRVSPECPGHLFDTPGTLSGHFLDTPEPGARRAPETPRATLPGHFGPEGPERLL